MASKKVNYEQSMNELEVIVERLESGEMSLEAAIAAYERGMKLVKSLDVLLGDAKRRVEILTKDGEEPFDEEEAET
jgi:exodeoxyribonuclease VII small subunit